MITWEGFAASYIGLVTGAMLICLLSRPDDPAQQDTEEERAGRRVASIVFLAGVAMLFWWAANE
jgi:hypothetical protein